MYVSGGKVFAIDKVNADKNTLAGDGVFDALRVRDDVFLKIDKAEQTFQPKGNYATKNDLNSYYTKVAADAKFRTIEDSYSKEECESKLQPKGNYTTQKDLDALSSNVALTYLSKTDASSTYFKKTEVNDLSASLVTTMNQKDQDLKNGLSAYYVSRSGLSVSENSLPWVLQWDSKAKDYIWTTAQLGGGGQGGTTYFTAASGGLKTWEELGQNFIGLNQSAYDAVEFVANNKWIYDTVQENYENWNATYETALTFATVSGDDYISTESATNPWRLQLALNVSLDDNSKITHIGGHALAGGGQGGDTYYGSDTIIIDNSNHIHLRNSADYAMKNDIDGFITAEALDGYASEQWVSENFLSAVPSGYAKTDDLQKAIEPLAKSADVSAALEHKLDTTVSARFQPVSAMSGYYTKNETNATFLYAKDVGFNDDTVTAISGKKIASITAITTKSPISGDGTSASPIGLDLTAMYKLADK